MSEDIVYVCPECGGPAVEYSELTGGAARCKACKWSGTREQLLGVPFQHTLGSREGIGFELLNDTRRLLSDQLFAVQLGAFLNRWGFIDLQGDKVVLTRTLTRYIAAIARAILTALIEEREKIEKEKNV